MRSEWVPVSASALVTGAMALVLAQMLNPSGSNESPATVLAVAGNSSGRWLAMSVLFFGAAVGLVLGMPSVLSLFSGIGERRGRVPAMIGVGVFTVGAIGLAGLAALMLMFRALSLNEAADPALIGNVVADRGLSVMLGIWVYSFLGGVLLIAFALFRSARTPVWVPGLLVAFLAIQLVTPSAGRVMAAIGLMAFAAGLTGIAISATSDGRQELTTRSRRFQSGSIRGTKE